MTTEEIVAAFVYQVVEMGISFAEEHLDGEDLANVLKDVAHKGEDAFEDHTGEPLNPSLVEEEDTL